MPLSFSESNDYPHHLDSDFLLLVKMKGEQMTTGLMQTSKQILDAAGNTQRRHKPKVTRIIVSSPVVFQRGQYFSPWCHETCEQRVWLFLDIFSTPATGVHWVGISNFITCHKRDTGCSGEHCSLPPLPTPPPSTPPLARHHTRPWKSCLEREDEDFPVGGCSRWPADIHIVFWLLIDLRAVKSSWSHKARRCLFIYPSVCVNPQLDTM